MSHNGRILDTVRVCHIMNIVWPLCLPDQAVQWVWDMVKWFLEFDYNVEYDWRLGTVRVRRRRCRAVAECSPASV